MLTAVWRHDSDSEEQTSEIYYAQGGYSITHAVLSASNKELRNLFSHVIGKVDTRIGGYARIERDGVVELAHSAIRHPKTNQFSVYPDGR